MDKRQKHFTEVGLLQASKGVILLKPADLSVADKMSPEQRALINQARVYVVCERPRIRIINAQPKDESGIQIEVAVPDFNFELHE